MSGENRTNPLLSVSKCPRLLPSSVSTSKWGLIPDRHRIGHPLNCAPVSPTRENPLPANPRTVAASSGILSSPVRYPAISIHSAASPIGKYANCAGNYSNRIGVPTNHIGNPAIRLGEYANSIGNPANPIRQYANRIGVPANPAGNPASSLGNLLYRGDALTFTLRHP